MRAVVHVNTPTGIVSRDSPVTQRVSDRGEPVREVATLGPTCGPKGCVTTRCSPSPLKAGYCGYIGNVPGQRGFRAVTCRVTAVTRLKGP